MERIKSSEEATRIIHEMEALFEAGHKLTEEQECILKFAKIFLSQIEKRREKAGPLHLGKSSLGLTR